MAVLGAGNVTQPSNRGIQDLISTKFSTVMETHLVQERSIEISPLKLRLVKQEWLKIYTAIVEYGHLQIRFNRQTRSVDLRTCETTADPAYMDRSATFISAIVEGFKFEDALALMKYRDVFMESFEIGEIRKLKNSHMSRAIGRIIGREGRTKESIENFSRCKFVLNDQKIVILGCPDNIKMAKDGIGRLVQGAEPSSIFNRLRMISAKIKDKYGSIHTVYDDLKR